MTQDAAAHGGAEQEIGQGDGKPSDAVGPVRLAVYPLQSGQRGRTAVLLAHDLAARLPDQAERRLSRETKRPKQARLRRAVSIGYYALFPLLVAAATRTMAPASPLKLGLQTRRSFEHGAMKSVCKGFAGGSLAALLQHLQTGPIEADLRKVVQLFVELQEKRHAADYDLVDALTKQAAADDINKVMEAFSAWQAISKLPNASVFLMALALPRIGGWRDRG